MKVDLFDFDLPQENIAQEPARPRDSARLLHVKTGGLLADNGVPDLPGLLQPGDIMVFNNTKVIPARLTGYRRRDGALLSSPKIEITLHKRNADKTWQSLARPGRKLAAGDRLVFGEGFESFVTHKLEGGEFTLDFMCSENEMRDGLQTCGIMPLPPYIRRGDAGAVEDRSDYQTVYARHEGAVAAPTAGLHFTDELLGALDKRGISRVFVTLHVGAGTFLPVRVDDTDDHRMHAEWGEISPETADQINAAKRDGGRIVAVGTTSLRLLESAVSHDGVIQPFRSETDIFITPGFEFKAVDLLMTNFHLPRSTLFMLVCAFAGRETMHKAYIHAIEAGYRFYSYGDASLLEKIPA